MNIKEQPATKNDINLLDSKIEKLGTDLRKDIEDVLGAVKDIMDISSDKFSVMEGKFEIMEGKFEIMEGEFEKARNERQKLRNDIRKIFDYLDGMEKRLEINEDERLVMGHKLDRLNRWTNELADKIGHKLTT